MGRVACIGPFRSNKMRAVSLLPTPLQRCGRNVGSCLWHGDNACPFLRLGWGGLPLCGTVRGLACAGAPLLPSSFFHELLKIISERVVLF